MVLNPDVMHKAQKELDSIVAAYTDRHTVFNKSQKALKDVRNIQRKIRNSKLNENIKNDLLHKLSIKEEQLQVVSFVSSSIKVKAIVVTLAPITLKALSIKRYFIFSSSSILLLRIS